MRMIVVGSKEWHELTARRAALIHKKNRGGLSGDETIEFNYLQEISRRAVEENFGHIRGWIPPSERLVPSESIPRCDNLDGSTLKILPAYTEAGQYCEARCLTITDGVRTAVYVPVPSVADTV